MEEQTGYSHRFDSQDHGPNRDRDVRDYRHLAKTLGAESCRFVVIKSAIANAVMLNEFIVEQLLCTDEYMPNEEKKKFKNAGTMKKALLERVKIVASSLRLWRRMQGLKAGFGRSRMWYVPTFRDTP